LDADEGGGLERSALEARDDRLRLALRAAGGGVWEWTLENDRVEWSPEVYAMLGVDDAPDGSDPYRLWLSVIHPDDIGRAEEAARSAARGEALSFDFRIRRPRDGEIRWIRSQSTVALGKAGRPERVIGVNFDVTDQYEAAAALRESEAELKLITDALPELISFIDRDCIYRFANRAYESWYGRHPEEIIGRHVREVVGDDGFAFRLPFIDAALAGEDCRLEVAVRQPDGRLRHGDVRYMPRFGKGGKVEGFYAFVIDITERKTAEQALQRLNETLETQIEERTRALRATEEALRQSQKMEAIGQLTGGLAHDFNNILAAISGSLEFIKRRIASGRVQEVGKYLDAAVAASKRAADLTQRLLAFARRQSLEAKPVDVNGLVGSMGHLLRRTMGGEISVETRPDEVAGLALTDASQLESALLNLAINARDAMAKGGTLTISTGRITVDGPNLGKPGLATPGLTPGNYVRVSVADTGEGMPPDVLARVFDPFFTTKPIGQGTGLGLSMVYGFARQTGGHVHIESRPGEGTKVDLYLPSHAGERPLLAAGGSLGETPRAEPGETVLVVEDEIVVRRLIVEVLAELGYATMEAHDALSAMPVIESDARIDILVSDVGLPGINGRDLADIARRIRPALPVLFVTGFAQSATARDGFLATGMDLIFKPFSLDELAGRIRAAINAARQP
jgi:PAS domain S-box-containing protein